MRKIIALFSMAVFSTDGAALPDYDLSRLPPTVAQQVNLGGGQTRVVIPTSVSNAGIMGGSRLRWQHNDEICYDDNNIRDDLLCVDDQGNYLGISRLLNETGYLYDLNTKQFIAQTINGHSVSHVGDEHYIGKRLRLDTWKWQTLRCEISGLVQSPNGSYNNSSCVVIDDDALDETPHLSSQDEEDCEPEGTCHLEPNAFWSQRYITVMMVSRVLFSILPSNALSSTVVWDIPDELPGPDDFNIKWADGQSQTQSALTAELSVLVSEPVSVLGGLGSLDGKDVAWLLAPGLNNGDISDTPDKVYKIVRNGPSDYSATSHVFSDTLVAGNYNRVLSVSKEGLVYTNKGTCKLSSGCGTYAGFSSEFLPATLALHATENRVLFYVGDENLEPVDPPNYPERRRAPVTDIRGPSFATYDMMELITAQYGEYFNRAPEANYFYSDQWGNYYNVGSFPVWSPSGEYFVITGIDQFGNNRAYLFRED